MLLGLDESNLSGLDFDVAGQVSKRSVGFRRSSCSLQEVGMRLMWTGAAFVLFGSIGYTTGSRPREAKSQEKPEQEQI